MKPITAITVRLGRRLASLLCVASLSACSVLPRPEPPTVYRLPLAASTPTAAIAAVRPWSLQVATPLASAAINRSAITVLPRPDLVNNYRGSRWSDPAPVLFRDALVRQLQGRYPAAAITTDDSDLATRYRLAGRLEAFQSEYRNGQPRVVIHYDAQLLVRDTQNAIAVRSFEVSVRPSSAKVPDIVTAFGEATTQIDAQLQAWLAPRLAASTDDPPSAT